MVEQRLRNAGVIEVGSSGRCTFSEPEQWFSHRRDAPCGRMASIIWLE
jgi:copper oxidase (laccase) domain-containing protein